MSRVKSLNAILAALISAIVASACLANFAEPTEPMPQLSQAASLAEAEAELYGGEAADATSTTHTYGLMLINRGFGTDQDPNPKYRVVAEVVTDKGQTRWYADTDWLHMPSGEMDDGRFYRQQLRVVNVRFHWRDRLVLGDQYSTEWVQAAEGKFLWYVTLRWTGDDNKWKPLLKIERPLPPR